MQQTTRKLTLEQCEVSAVHPPRRAATPRKCMRSKRHRQPDRRAVRHLTAGRARLAARRHAGRTFIHSASCLEPRRAEPRRSPLSLVASPQNLIILAFPRSDVAWRCAWRRRGPAPHRGTHIVRDRVVSEVSQPRPWPRRARPFARFDAVLSMPDPPGSVNRAPRRPRREPRPGRATPRHARHHETSVGMFYRAETCRKSDYRDAPSRPAGQTSHVTPRAAD